MANGRLSAVGYLLLAIIISAVSPAPSVAGEEGIAPARLPGGLQCIPADYAFVAGINGRQLQGSPLWDSFRKFRAPQGADIGALTDFFLRAGIDPQRDISYLLVAAKSVEGPDAKNLNIALGRFDSYRIADHVRSGTTLVPLEYGGVPIMQFEDKRPNAIKGVALLSAFELAIGDIECIRDSIDTKSGRRPDIRSDASISPLLQAVDFDRMVWFIANIPHMPGNVRLPLSPGGDAQMRSIAGSLNFTQNITGNLIGVAPDAGSATRMADALKGLIALGQMSGKPNPDMRALLNGIIVIPKDAQVNVFFDLPVALIQKMAGGGGFNLPALLAGMANRGFKPESARGTPGKPDEPEGSKASVPDRFIPMAGAPGIKNPVPRIQPVPAYTVEARKARIEGEVIIGGIIRKDGSIDSCTLIKGLGYGLDESAINTVAGQWRFDPATLDGRPVDVRVIINVSFRLSNTPAAGKP